MNEYMQKVHAVAKKVVVWRKVEENKKKLGGSLSNQIAWVIYEQEIPVHEAPRTKNFQSLVVGVVKEMELEADGSDPELPL
ncbi:hypothetical protein EPO17_00805 [Patescibacteria group bacterium]|nr:MAG: hypothetical protein EPO17_00805 [Patescibacteria group bacterium]